MEWTSIINCAYDASFSIAGATTDATRIVSVQLKDFEGKDLTERACIYAYLSNDEYGDSVVTAVETCVIDGDGVLEDITSAVSFMLTSEADGDIDVKVGETGTGEYYLVLVMPNGKLVVSDMIEFT